MYAIRMGTLFSEVHFLPSFEVRANIYASVLLAVVLIFLVKKRSRTKSALSHSDLAPIPGPKPWPILGNLPILFDRKVPIWDLILQVQKRLCKQYNKVLDTMLLGVYILLLVLSLA